MALIPKDGEHGEHGERLSLRYPAEDTTRYIPQYNPQQKATPAKPAKPKPVARPTDGVKLFRDSVLFVLGTSVIVALGIVCIRLLMALWAVL